VGLVTLDHVKAVCYSPDRTVELIEVNACIHSLYPFYLEVVLWFLLFVSTTTTRSSNTHLMLAPALLITLLI
jgi:hypothetical protein